MLDHFREIYDACGIVAEEFAPEFFAALRYDRHPSRILAREDSFNRSLSVLFECSSPYYPQA